MAKKRAAQKKPVKTMKAAKPAKPAKPVKPVKTAARTASSQSPASGAVVLFTLRDSGASAVRFHSDHQDVARAKGVAQGLANSPDVADAFVVTGVEIVRRAGQF
jgi:hypothetical protein